MPTILKEYLEPLSYFIYLFLVSYIWSISNSNKVRLLCFYYVLATVAMSIAPSIVNNNKIYNFFFFLTGITLPFYFHQILDNRFSKKLIQTLIVVNLLLFLVFFLKNIVDGDNNYLRAYNFFCIIICSLLYYYELMTKASDINILYRFDFWLTCGYLFYFLGSFCIVLYYKYPSPYQRGLLWSIQNIILFISAVITIIKVLSLINRKKLEI